MPHLAHVSIVVHSYDEAIAFYVDKLGFTVVEDTPIPSQNKRWITIRPPGAPEGAATIVIAEASGEGQAAIVGNQGAGRVWLFLETDSLARDYNRFKQHGVEFVREPVVQPYGQVAVFQDLYGNQWDLIQRNK